MAAALARDDARAFHAALAGCNGAHDTQVLAQVRDVASGLQTALEQFSEDSRLADLAERQVPDARQRLAHVLKLTDDAAHRTLDLVEKSCPLADEAVREAERLRGLRRRATDTLDVEVQSYLERTARQMSELRGNLSEVLMAQGYQDISGQIIRNVMKLVDELEQVLGDMMELTGGGGGGAAHAPDGAAAHGPAIPGVDEARNVNGQMDVDALLSGLGM
jgi:chemotaxis protein CheZ